MTNVCTIQLFNDNHWHEVATVLLCGPEDAGCLSETLTGYTTDWTVAHAGAIDAFALSSQSPVALAADELKHWPVFLIDMLPQGFGREELLRQLGLPETLGAVADWRLLQAGAGNPIGHLRIKEAADWLASQAGSTRGFSDQEVADRSDDFMHYLSLHGLFVAGSSGVQGAWPKVLLTRARDGMLYLDHTLPDAEAVEHYIVKFGRGENPQLALILRMEAPYMAVAAHLGLRVHKPLSLHQRALLIPRFDRVVSNGRVTRLGQESLAVLTNRAGFGVVPSHEEVCVKLAEVCSNPLAEIQEYLCRDVANLAMGNKDNHARNTALQRDFDGRIALTPLFDFAPMYLHPDGIARRIRWAGNDGSSPDWSRVLDTVCEISNVPRAPLVASLQLMIPRLQDIAGHGQDFGLDAAVLSARAPSIRAQIAAIEKL